VPLKSRITARAACIRNPTHPSIRSYPGRASIKAKTHPQDDIVVVVLRGSGFTPLEQTMMDSPYTDRAERVVAMREDPQRMMAKRYEETIEQLTDRKVAFLSEVHLAPDITLEIFFIDHTLDGFGALAVIDGSKAQK
jgi:uncharacterized protein YbcI